MTTAPEYRQMASETRQRVNDSYERSGSDGFVSQWAGGVTAREYELKAEITENGGKDVFPALFDLEGNLVPAKLIDTRYGRAWGLLPDDDPRGSFTGWFSPSNAATESYRIRNNEKKGYYEGTVMAPAAVTIAASGRGLSGAMSARPISFRTDGGFSREVDIIDNGK